MNDATQARTSAPEPGDDALALAGRTLIRERIRGIRKVVGRRLGPSDIVLRRTAPDVRAHLFEEACELYWNEMSWEEITEEELVGDDELIEMIFPGLLALVDAFLPRAPNGEPDRDRERRDVAHDFLYWLGTRLVTLREARPEPEHELTRIRRQTKVTDGLIDLIAFRVCSLNNDEIEAYQKTR
ncbi:hypothetical protein [Candidatus Palauibacter sp.]|uniref:hypothetical protein n=1 Tax=Candidatus Palauibacter sp. TaxID=3101350 RepID=UPI003B02910C